MLKVYVSEEEHELIQQKMASTHVTNFSRYARKMLIDGYIIHQDYNALKLLTRELANLARSINQIAKRCNETRNLHTHEVEELRRYYMDVKRACSERLVKMLKE